MVARACNTLRAEPAELSGDPRVKTPVARPEDHPDRRGEAAQLRDSPPAVSTVPKQVVIELQEIRPSGQELLIQLGTSTRPISGARRLHSPAGGLPSLSRFFHRRRDVVVVVEQVGWVVASLDLDQSFPRRSWVGLADAGGAFVGEEADIVRAGSRTSSPSVAIRAQPAKARTTSRRPATLDARHGRSAQTAGLDPLRRRRKSRSARQPAPLVRAGATFVDGKLVKRPDDQDQQEGEQKAA
jgi:hypothetical protein